ncbi:hypothetical protein DFH07DRAFT_417115 [Mycena maculata]|uniref:Uncharacterized protein n=1 Tax=Mycena maculata TaxID=230809 RepID=A0AAD7NIL1_9AGAR|nr:hypothetical protein DFH07DRAFT_417115 [Mycena maculata]
MLSAEATFGLRTDTRMAGMPGLSRTLQHICVFLGNDLAWVNHDFLPILSPWRIPWKLDYAEVLCWEKSVHLHVRLGCRRFFWLSPEEKKNTSCPRCSQQHRIRHPKASGMEVVLLFQLRRIIFGQNREPTSGPVGPARTYNAVLSNEVGTGKPMSIYCRPHNVTVSNIGARKGMFSAILHNMREIFGSGVNLSAPGMRHRPPHAVSVLTFDETSVLFPAISSAYG